jgi:hypothetical protein
MFPQVRRTILPEILSVEVFMVHFKRVGLLLVFVLVGGASVRAQMRDNGPDMPIDATAKGEVIRNLTRGLRDAYVFPEVGERAAAMLETRLAGKEYDSVTTARAFGDLLTQQLLEIAKDKHLRVRYSSQPLPAGSGDPRRGGPPAGMVAQQRKNNFAFERVERLSGNIGYLKLNGFMDPAGAGAVAAGAMAFLANTDALIIDLRQNGGGRPDMVAVLASYFFRADAKVHLNDLANRVEGTKNYETMESWTLPTLPAERYLDKPVYILTSPRTFSGAEEFSYDLQALKRATIVGEPSGGGANPGGPLRLGDHFEAFMPRGHAINPITKTNWEGTGVQPDVRAPQADALNTAQALALKALIAKSTDPQEQAALTQALASVDPNATAPATQASSPASTASPTAPAATAGGSTPAATLAGTWTGQVTDPGGNKHALTLELKVEGAKITGTITGGPPTGETQPIVNGKVDGDEISLEVTISDPGGNPVTLTYAGKRTGNRIEGQIKSKFGDLPFTAFKQ